MISKRDIAEYYDTTLNHYIRWWSLKKHLSLHYGIWEKSTKNFHESLINTNKVLSRIGSISQKDQVLDAGCGVGGAAMFLAKENKANVVGISLSEKQIDLARKTAAQEMLTNRVSFEVMDYCNTGFEDESFDVVWACESVCHAGDKSAFLKEAYRILKKSGRLILSDFFLCNDAQKDPKSYIKKWINLWGVPNLVSAARFKGICEHVGFCNTQIFDYTENIRPSAKRLYYSAILGTIPSEIYNFLHPSVSGYAKRHYRSGIYQYKALNTGLWTYNVFLAVK